MIGFANMLVFAAVLLCAVVEADIGFLPGMDDSSNSKAAILSRFQAFLHEHGKVYDDETTFTKRLEIFSQNAMLVDAFNRNQTVGGPRLSINQFADLTKSEFKQMYLSSLSTVSSHKEAWGPTATSLGSIVADSVDWRKKGAVTPVKDQKNCGACWAFSTIGAIEAAWYLAGHPLVTLSEQELVDCSAGFRGGCAGGEPSDAFNWVKQNGICTNQSYPWTSFQDECHNQFFPCQVVTRIQGYTLVQENDEQALKAAVAQQPISVQIEADTDIFRLYKSGVLKDSGCGTALDHAVLAIGYGTENGQDYWLVKNSWNASWGEQGYVRLARTNSSASWGECGIAMRPMYPVISTGNNAVLTV
eukprot:TRINITY_DN63696_c0_g1_i1.p1 TRINITY_DN63696_c0_g1~~TRINITY_DN63696_c0_g1_i1.p1  ORF type:complete len:359 (-),score=40.23 TRINITY_DN63696_c0_g1_i1:62-1138(-)